MIRRTMVALAALIILALPALADETTETVVTLSTVQGDIVLRFFPDSAPEHVKNFIFHSREGNYTGTYFHRVIPGFMIQGGDFLTKDEIPTNDGTGGYSYKGPGTKLPAEFNDRKHERGILSMARSRDKDSAGSQFFIMHARAKHLDGQYTVFGEVIDGIEVVDKIVNVKATRPANRPVEKQTVVSVTVSDWTTESVEAAKAAMWEEDEQK